MDRVDIAVSATKMLIGVVAFVWLIGIPAYIQILILRSIGN